MDKVHGGTPKGFQSLCTTCRYAHVSRGLNLQERIVCNFNSNRPTQLLYPIEVCNYYDDKRMPSLYQMEQIAWEVKSRNRAPCGFVNDGNVEITIEPPKKEQPNQPPPMTGDLGGRNGIGQA